MPLTRPTTMFSVSGVNLECLTPEISGARSASAGLSC
jgi:hypothetical protein